LCAVLLGNQELIHKKKILKSFDSFAWLMQIVLFLTLGLLVYPSQIIPVMGIGILISLFLIIIARPLSIFLCLLPFKIPNRNKILYSWVGLRGAVPIVFATYPLLAGADKANMIFDIVFFISLTSVLIQGTSLSKVANWLKLTLPEELKKVTQKDLEIYDSIKSLLTEIVIPQNSSVKGKQIVQLGLPKNTLISIIFRDRQYITPSGSTTIEAGDKLFILAEDEDSLKNVFKCLDEPVSEK
ncbi:MAG: cation:proton antiporter, partial [Prolixibacteraceae bacterium]|nr:cation:proton antiporter [Prolixibacteraceae bacterium]